MINLFAIPFDRFKNKLTNDGIVYNIQDKNGLLYSQVEVINTRFKRHDCGVEEQSEAPNEVRSLLIAQLNKMCPDGWKVHTAFNRKETIDNDQLRVTDIHDQARAVIFIDNEPGIAKVSLNISKGLR